MVSIVSEKSYFNESDIDFNLIEAFFFAYRDFTADADVILEHYDFGRAHHRVLYFVNRDPGLNVAELLDILRITKQSLARVLKQLIDTDHIISTAGLSDKRQRELYPTQKGIDLILKLAILQSRRINTALQRSGANSHLHVEMFLKAMVEK
jgi:DNA-binding MarR family transcriptional regulator